MDEHNNRSSNNHHHAPPERRRSKSENPGAYSYGRRTNKSFITEEEHKNQSSHSQNIINQPPPNVNVRGLIHAFDKFSATETSPPTTFPFFNSSSYDNNLSNSKPIPAPKPTSLQSSPFLYSNSSVSLKNPSVSLSKSANSYSWVSFENKSANSVNVESSNATSSYIRPVSPTLNKVYMTNNNNNNNSFNKSFAASHSSSQSENLVVISPPLRPSARRRESIRHLSQSDNLNKRDTKSLEPTLSPNDHINRHLGISYSTGLEASTSFGGRTHSPSRSEYSIASSSTHHRTASHYASLSDAAGAESPFESSEMNPFEDPVEHENPFHHVDNAENGSPNSIHILTDATSPQKPSPIFSTLTLSPDLLKPNLPPRPSGQLDDNYLTLSSLSYNSSTTVNKNFIKSNLSDVHNEFLQMHTSRSSPQYLNQHLNSVNTKDSAKTLLLFGNHLCVGVPEGVQVVPLQDPDAKFIVSIPENRKIHSLMSILPNSGDSSLNATSSRRIWAGLDKGDVYEICLLSGTILNKYQGLLNGTVTHMLSYQTEIMAISEQGKVIFWQPIASKPQRTLSLRIKPDPQCICLAGQTLWVSYGKTIDVYSFSGTELPSRISIDVHGVAGAVSFIDACEPRGLVISGHEDGKMVVWDMKDHSKKSVMHLSSYRITSCCIVFSRYIWVGFSTGKIHILDLNNLDRPAFKDFQAHAQSAVYCIALNINGLLLDEGFPVIASLSTSGKIKFWDPFLSYDQLEFRLWGRQSEFCTFCPTTLQIISWNINATKPFELEENGFWSEVLKLHSKDSPDLIVVGFQEIVDLESGTVTAKELFKKDQLNTNDDRGRQWQDSIKIQVEEVLKGERYSLLECRQMVGLFQIVLLKQSLGLTVRDSTILNVKTGLGGYHGNKGGLIARVIVEDSTFCFVNTHLAAHQKEITARNSDCHSILKETVLGSSKEPCLFLPGGDGSHIMDNEFVFWFGDMNYRVDMNREKVIDLKYDQLRKQVFTNPHFALRFLQEHDILFAPTFKYDLHSTQYDTSEKKRIPSWCDRILWKGTARCQYYNRLEFQNSDHRPVTALFQLQVKRIDKTIQSSVYSNIQSELEKEKQTLLVRHKIFWLIDVTGFNYDICQKTLDEHGGHLVSAFMRLMKQG